MPEFVIDFFEVIEIQSKNSQMLMVSLKTGKTLFRIFQDAAPVGNACQFVGGGTSLQFTLQIPE